VKNPASENAARTQMSERFEILFVKNFDVFSIFVILKVRMWRGHGARGDGFADFFAKVAESHFRQGAVATLWPGSDAWSAGLFPTTAYWAPSGHQQRRR
jgi:hypothetical protein